MREQAFRYPSTSILVFALLLALPGLAAAGEEPLISPQAREAFEAVAPDQAKGCRLCAFVHQRCSATCFSLAEKGGMGECLMACDNSAATCTCDQAVSLQSEELVSWDWPDTTKAAACHGTVSCQPNYPSCASWSGYSDCGDPQCGIYRWCGNCGDPFGCWDPATRQPRERFRVCFNQLGQSCTEWESTLVLAACGC